MLSGPQLWSHITGPEATGKVAANILLPAFRVRKTGFL